MPATSHELKRTVQGYIRPDERTSFKSFKEPGLIQEYSTFLFDTAGKTASTKLLIKHSIYRIFIMPKSVFH